MSTFYRMTVVVVVLAFCACDEAGVLEEEAPETVLQVDVDEIDTRQWHVELLGEAFELVDDNGLNFGHSVYINDGRFALLIEWNPDGAVGAYIATADVEEGAPTELIPISERNQGMFNNALMTAVPGGYLVFWSTRYSEWREGSADALWMRETDVFGEPTGSPTMIALPELRQPSYVRAVRVQDDVVELLMWAPGHGLGQYQYRPHLLTLSRATGEVLGPPRALLDHLGREDHINHGTVMWPDTLLYADNIPRDRSGAVFSVPMSNSSAENIQTLYSTDNGAVHFYRTQSSPPDVVGIYDTGVGGVLLDVESGDVVATLPEGDRPVLSKYPDLGWGVLLDYGEYAETNPLSTGVGFYFLDKAFEPVAPLLSVGISSSKCLEHHSMTRSGNVFGVLWQRGCNRRKLYFTRVRVRYE